MRKTQSIRQRSKSNLPVSAIAITRSGGRLPSRSRVLGKRAPEEGEIITILGEPFLLTTIAEKRVLRHPRWSLMGVGKTRAEAHAALFEEASDVAEFYREKPDDLLTEDAVALKHFLEKLLS